MNTTTNSNSGMKQMVINKYEKVIATRDGSFSGMYDSVTEALDGVGQLYQSTVWSEKVEKVRIYGVITESNGYKHGDVCPIYVCGTDKLWDGRRPDIKEVKILRFK